MSEETEQSNCALMTSVARAFSHADLRPLFDALDENVVWRSSAPNNFFRFGGVHEKRPGVTELSALLFSTYQFARFDPKQIVAKGETVWGLFEVEAVHLPSGREIKSDLAIRWTVRDRKIVEHMGFFDTASVLIQQGLLAAT